MPALYIHIGQHKTGTSSLQRFCTRYRGELVERFNLCYPTPPDKQSLRHKSLFPILQDQWKRVRAEVTASGCTNILISDEGLYSQSISADDMRRIKELFPEHDIFFIVYLRRLDDYYLSWYKEGLKRGSSLSVTYAHFLRNATRQSLRSHPLRVLHRYKQLAGRDHVLVRAYDRSKLKNGNIVDDFFDILDITLPDDMDRSQDFNLSLPDAATPYVTDALQRARYNDPVSLQLRRKLMQAFSPPEHTDVSAGFLAGLEKEILQIDTLYLPGYHKLHADRPLDFRFPAPDANPRDLLIVDLLYSILFELQRKKSLEYRLKLFVKDKLRAVRAFFRRPPILPRQNG